MDIVILTALDLEYAAVRAHLTGLRTDTDANGTRYETGTIRGGTCRVALALTGPGNLAAATLTTRAIARFQPKALIFVGVAGGLAHDVAIGDVVVATRVHEYQGGKAAAGGFRARPRSWPLNHALEQDAREAARAGTWATPLPGEPAVHFKPIVSGDVVLDDRDSPVAALVAQHYNDAVAIDMESAGVAEAAHHNDFPRAVTVRAISDLADGTKRDSDAVGWQRRAVTNAAAFAIAVAALVAEGLAQQGADPHVVAGRGPVYLLANYVPARATTGTAQPSYLLNARSAVVPFTGRRDEVRDLTIWRDSDDRQAIRWLHAPGGQGKTRLAGHLADDSSRGGWKVITAEHTAGTVHAQRPSQDLRIGAATGLLLVVDYADRWPLAHLTWLLSNKVLTQDVPVRVLLLARTSHVWPALCHALTQSGWPPDSRTTQHLGPSASRGLMFTTARDSFARHYGLADPHAIRVPDGLERDEFGLTLAVHMAALVAGDRHARAAAQPLLEDPTALTAYLLDRERHHWHTLHDTATLGTTPQQMSRAVFTAALTGPLSYQDAKAALETVGVDTDALADHTFCYPPTDARTVLEPLYPDRLAEDFLALSVPGHDIPGPWADAWAESAPTLLPTARAITFLTAASDRWPHLVSTLEALAPLLPRNPSGALTIAAADLTERLAKHRLATATDPVERALIHTELGDRLAAAGRNEKAESAFREAVRLYRSLVDVLPPDVEPILAVALANSAGRLITTGLVGDWLTNEMNLATRGYRWLPPRRHEEAMTALGEALRTSGERDFVTLSEIMSGALILMERWQEARALVSATLTHLRAQPGASLAAVLDTYVVVLLNLDEPDEALPFAEEAVRLDPGALRSYARVLHKLKRYDESLHAMREAVRIARRTGGLRSELEALVQLLADQDRWAEALPAAEEAVRLARAEPEETLAGSLYQLALVLSHLDRREQEAKALDEAVSIGRGLAGHEHILSAQLAQLAIVLAELRRWHEALTAAAESVEILHRAAQHGVETHFTAAVNSLVGPEWQRPESHFDGDLAPVVDTFVTELSSPRRGDAAFPGLAEAIEEFRRGFVNHNPVGQLYRQLTGADPLMRDSPALTLRSLGRHEEALPLVCEETQLYQRLARSDPRTYEPMLVEAWVRTAVIMGELGLPSTAALETAIDLRRWLVRHDRAEHEPALAVELAILARALAKQGSWTEAVASVTESVEIQRRLGQPSTVEELLAALTDGG